MNNEGKCAIKLVHGLPNLEPSRNVSSKVIKQHLLFKHGGFKS